MEAAQNQDELASTLPRQQRMGMKGLHYVPAGETERWIAALKAQGTDTLAVFRFADDNDSAAYSFGTLWRICKTRQEVAEIVERSSKQQYMGRKRHQWYAAVKEPPND
jgi:hypothetical protein